MDELFPDNITICRSCGIVMEIKTVWQTYEIYTGVLEKGSIVLLDECSDCKEVNEKVYDNLDSKDMF